MDQRLSAIVARGPGNPGVAARLGLSLVEAGEFVIVPLDRSRVPHWAEDLGITDRQLSEMEPDCAVTLQVAKALGFNRFALIETSLGEGGDDQCATFYHGAMRTMPLRAGAASVNDALERVGVVPDGGWDAFATLGLGGMRHAELFARAS
ncbi:hypothetical protein [Pararhodobacter sp. CCB-MM2]|uniref:hypothetical protein n=1 Tax=Pararhodobacter sp. CCB-MM2 TaxID=1786003 RepID=UPI00082EA10D|nr:hypothetical protein [Pararhodobacter sp. CCB-MM2]